MMYNKSEKNNGIKQPTALRDYTSSWKQKNESALKYAGDLAKKSINAGLEEAKSFMKDADEGIKFEDVQTASVKWNLANDSNNKKLSNIAIKEMIGHLSNENKETYLKDVKSLQTYIDAKDELERNSTKTDTNTKSNKNENSLINNISEDDWLRIANALGYTKEDLNVVALGILTITFMNFKQTKFYMC